VSHDEQGSLCSARRRIPRSVECVRETAWPSQRDFYPQTARSSQLFTGDGAIYEMDTTSQEFNPTTVKGDPRELVFPLESPRSPDGTKVYLGYGRSDDLNQAIAGADKFRVFDTATWEQLGSIRTSVPFWSAVASNDGKFIYAIVPEQHSVLGIDATTLHETRAIDVWRTPALAAVAP
jgi:hypothetical protein